MTKDGGGGKRPIVDVQMDVSGSINGGWSVTTTYDPPRIPTNSGGNYVSRKRIRQALTETVVNQNGWRPPTAYRSAAIRRYSFPCAYYRTGGTSTIRSIIGTSNPTSGATYGYAPNDSLFISNLTGAPSVSTNLKNRAVTEAMNKLQQKKVDLGAALAELRPTVNGLAEIGLKLANLVWAIRKGHWEHARQILFGPRGLTPSDAGQAWLAWQYGIKPLMMDAHGLMEAFHKGILEKDLIVKVTRTVREDSTPLFVPTGPWTWAKQEGFVEDLVKVVIYGKISDAWKASAGSWGLSNPASAIWEGLGWSFLVDWLLPLGNFLDAMGATVGLSFLGGSMTTRKYAVLTYTVWPLVSGSVGVWEKPPVTVYKLLATERTVYNDWPTPWPYVRNPLSGTHVANAAALILALSR